MIYSQYAWEEITQYKQYDNSNTSDILQLLHMEIPIKAILPLAWEPPKIDASQWFNPHLVSSTPVLLTDRLFVF